MSKQLLTAEFLEGFPDFPAHMNELGKFVFYRTYSRFLPEKGRRETWKETCMRATEYNVGLGARHAEKIGYPVNHAKFKAEAEAFFTNMFNLRQFLSGRTLWVGGADGGVAEKYPLANFNCSFINIRSWDDFADLFYLLLVGTGVGFKSTKAFAAGMKPIRNNVEIIHEDYVQRYPLVKQPDTQLFFLDLDDGGRKAVIHVGDSKEGWVEALRNYFHLLTEHEYADVKQIGIFYDYIRPKGARLNTFGGTASGYEPLRDMFEGFQKVVRNELDKALDPPEQHDAERVKLRPVHMLDIGNMIGNNVVVGGVRRTAEIFLCDADDYESMLAKYGINGIWNAEQHGKVIQALRNVGLDKQADYLETLPLNDVNARPLHHRRMSNNSIAFETKPPREFIDLVYTIMQAEGEPGFINLEEARRRRPNAEGLNPCAEILLDSYGVCNLTTVNLVQFVEYDADGKATLNTEALTKAQEMSARAGLRMTLVNLEIPHWDAVQQRDRLLGTSLTGVKDAMEILGYDAYSERMLIAHLGEVSRRAADQYAKEMRVSAPLLVTTVKPEGTISQVAGGVSSGLHYSHAPYFIRRIRINATDPLAQAVMALNWPVHPEVGTPENKLSNARTIVVDFPVKSGAKVTKDDVNAADQFRTYFDFQRYYTEHNSSNTITVKPDEWGEVADIVYDNWDEFVGVSFLAHDGGSYMLAPYEAITEQEYDELVAKFKPFDPKALELFDTGLDTDLDGADGCEAGVCPVR